MGAPDGSASRGGWATPDCNTASYSNGMFGQNIREQASQWMTPNVPNGWQHVPPELIASKGMTEDGQKRTVGLESQVKYWPTPSAAVMNDGESPETWHARAAKLKLKHGNGNGAGLPLTVAVAQWPTPAARDYRSEQGGGEFVSKRMNETRGQTLSFAVTHFSLLAPPTHAGQESSETNPGSVPPSASKANTTPRLLSRRLNPYFAERLMGWRLGWTSTTAPSASSASETALWRCRLQQQLSCLFGEPD